MPNRTVRKQPAPRNKRKRRSQEQAARLDAVFSKQQSCDSDPLDDVVRVIVDPDAYEEP